MQLVAATAHLYLRTTVFSCVTENYNSRSNLQWWSDFTVGSSVSHHSYSNSIVHSTVAHSTSTCGWYCLFEVGTVVMILVFAVSRFHTRVFEPVI